MTRFANKTLINATLVVLTAVFMEIHVLWHVTPCGFVSKSFVFMS
jgi:hypothetical protein